MANRPKGYGMTAELQDKKDAKYSVELAQEAVDWINLILGEALIELSLTTGDHKNGFHEALKDGVILCQLAGKLGTPIKYNNSKMAFKQMENISKFLDFCTQQGVVKTDMFQTVDLYEAENIHTVVGGIHALARKVCKKNPDLPPLGPKEADQNKREFTEEQLQAGKNVIGLQMGTNTGASQSGMNFGLGRQIRD